MEWANVTYNERIVQGLHGRVSRGELAAVMGPSGSGKSYTLGILSGRRTHLTTGSIWIDGVAMSRLHVKNICLVQQKDAFFPNLTLFQTLSFAANLRLSRMLSGQEKMKVVTNVLKLLDLEACRNIRCGDGETYGLSGGERKRLNIACEMISNPDIILLDEPTSGLDAAAAKNIINFLRDFAVREGKIVIISIHQPSSYIFKCFHKLLLLHEGRQIFFGPPENALLCMQQKGFTCPTLYNPAEFILEVLPEVDSRSAAAAAAGCCFSDTSVPVQAFGGKDQGMAELMGPRREKSPLPSIDWREQRANVPYFPASYQQQFVTLARRSWSHRWDKIINRYTTAEVTAISMFMCVIWFQVGFSFHDIERRKALLYFLTQYWAFHAPYKVMFSFPSERDVVRRERASGWYSLSAYYLAKCAVELPLICLFPCAMLAVVYWMCGMAGGLWAFASTLAIVLLTVVEFNALGVAIGCTAMSYQHTLTLCAICLLMMLMFGGFYSRRLPAGLAWTRYLSLFNYTWYALLAVHFNSHTYHAPPYSNETESDPGQILAEAGVEMELCSYITIILTATGVFYIYGYLALRHLNKPDSEYRE